MGLAMTYFRIGTILSSALVRFTVLFGMGRSGTKPLWSPNINCQMGKPFINFLFSTLFCLISEMNVFISKLYLCFTLFYCKVLQMIESSLTSNQYGLASRVTALLHPTYQRPGLERLFRRIKSSGKSHLQASFALRCFQRLSLPNLATRRCDWRHNRYTRGSSTPVLSYQEQPPSNFQRPLQIGTKLSHDVLNPAHVPL